MKSDVISVSSMKDQTDAVMEQAEKVAVYQGLSTKNALHLRLLAEEMMSMMRAITGDVRGQFWIENEKDQFQLRLNVRTQVDFRQREKLLSASSSGKNEATRGFMGKIRSFFEPSPGVPMFSSSVVGGAPQMFELYTWSMEDYRDQLRQHRELDQRDSQEAWDELERSVVAKLADDVKVSIRGRNVEMIIIKNMA